jgi:hypothetical protein
MLEHLMILAQTAESPEEPLFSMQALLDSFWAQITSLSWLQAVVAISFGMVYLLYGWRIFKVLVVICFGLVGLFAGIKIGAQFDAQVLGGIVGLSLLAGISVPLMRWAVSILGAIAGGVLAGGVWYAVGLPEQYILAGAIIGIVAGGMISFIIFKIAVMLFTSLGGGTLIVMGMLSLLHQYESVQEPPTESIKTMFYSHQWFLPVLLLVPTFIGVMLQNKFIKGSKSWSV